MSKSGGGFDVSGLGDFVKRHGAQVATTAISYKMGGKIGKVLAAGQAADLVNKYKNEQKHKGQTSTDYGGGGGGGYPSSSQPHYDGGDHYGGAGHGAKSSGGGLDSLLNTGKGLLQKAKGKLDGGGGGSSSSFPASPSPYGASPQPPPYSPPTASTYSSGGGYDAVPDIMKFLVDGAVLQLTSAVTNRPLQIVCSYADGSLVLDANGSDSPDAFNSHFTVVRVDARTIQLHNNHNYVALSFGRPLVIPPGGAGGDSRLVIRELSPCVVTLSDTEGRAVGMGADGSATSAHISQPEARFIVRFLYSPPPPTQYGY